MDYDIIIYAFIALIVLAKLWSVLGQRNENDRERPNPFAMPPIVRDSLSALSDDKPDTLPALPKPLLFAPDSLAGGLASVKDVDAAFDEKQFLQTARSLFTQILGDFVKGDMAGSANLLAPALLPHFQAAIVARGTQAADHKLISIREAECVAAKTENGKAIITVRFVSNQQSGANDVEEITDLWVFARDPKAANSGWVLIETRS